LSGAADTGRRPMRARRAADPSSGDAGGRAPHGACASPTPALA
jgi:hypothetical protein